MSSKAKSWHKWKEKCFQRVSEFQQFVQLPWFFSKTRQNPESSSVAWHDSLHSGKMIVVNKSLEQSKGRIKWINHSQCLYLSVSSNISQSIPLGSWNLHRTSSGHAQFCLSWVLLKILDFSLKAQVGLPQCLLKKSKARTSERFCNFSNAPIWTFCVSYDDYGPIWVLLLKVRLQLLQLLCQLNTALLQAGNVTINGSTIQLGKIGEQVAKQYINLPASWTYMWDVAANLV